MTPPGTFLDDIRSLPRNILRMSRAARFTLAVLLALAAVPAAGVVTARPALAAEEPIAVGTELMATSDVTLHQAEIAKGSRVSVTKLSKTGGQLDAVSVALADGHVVKVTMAQVHTYFRVVGE
jgi:hypothetical protein